MRILLAFLVLSATVFGTGGAWADQVTADQAPGFDVKMVNMLLEGPNPMGPNCASTALLATGSLKVPIFIDPSKLQELLNDPACAHAATGPVPGTIGATIVGNEYVHFYAILKGAMVFQRGNTSDHFSVLPLAQAEVQFGTQNDYHQWVGGPACELSIFQKYIDSGKADPVIKGAVALLNKSFGLPYDKKAGFDLQKAHALLDDFNHGIKHVIVENRRIDYYLIRILMDATYSQDAQFAAEEAVPALKLVFQTVKETSTNKWIQKAADFLIPNLNGENAIIYVPGAGPGYKFDLGGLSTSCIQMASQGGVFDPAASQECEDAFKDVSILSGLFAAYQEHPNPALRLAPPVIESETLDGLKYDVVRINAVYAGKAIAFIFMKM